MSKVVYFDLDGVVADFAKHYLAEYGDINNKKVLDFNKKSFARDKFFLNLPIIEVGIELLEYVSGFDVHIRILTAVGDNDLDVNLKYKREWVAKHLGDLSFSWVKKAPEKSKFASETSFLFDDRPKSLNPFLDAGGKGFLFSGDLIESKLAFDEFLKG